jgi:hypothetical protein
LRKGRWEAESPLLHFDRECIEVDLYLLITHELSLPDVGVAEEGICFLGLVSNLEIEDKV